jgi:hypothetical protein
MGLQIRREREDFEFAIRVLNACETVAEACEILGAQRGWQTSPKNLRKVFGVGRVRFPELGLKSPGAYLKSASYGSVDAIPPRVVLPSSDESTPPEAFSISGGEPKRFQRLVEVLKRGPLGFSALCDKLDLSPGKARSLIEAAQSAGVQVHVENDHVGIRGPVQDDRVVQVGVAPVVGETQRVAVISDTHLGSKYCLRDQLRDFVNSAYDSGIREVLHVGDALDGCYRHGVFELTHSGLDDQCQDLFEVLPHRPGLTYHAISGNHDQTFSEKTGMSIGHHISGYFRDRGRNDLKFYGDRSAFLKVRGAVIHLWHPRVSPSYAASYQVQKQIERYSSIKPQALLCGHWHRFVYIYERGVHGIACPTFQGGQSSFGKSLGGSPAIGGLILSWSVTEHGTIRDFGLTKRSYFEREEPIQIFNTLDAEQIAPMNAVPKAVW